MLLSIKFQSLLKVKIKLKKNSMYIVICEFKVKENLGKKLPESASEIRKKMKDACQEIKILHHLEVIEDLLKKN